MPRYNILVKGRVQGVGFRYFVEITAKQMELTGWVKNLDNGQVQMEVQNNSEFIDKLLGKLKKGNGFSRVDNLEYKIVEDISNEKNFRITY